MKDQQGTYLVDVYTDVGSPKVGSSPQSPRDVGARDQLEHDRHQGFFSPGSIAQGGSSPDYVPVPIGERVFCDKGLSLEQAQPWWEEAFALVTMSLYLSWIHILMLLVVAAFFSKTAMWICIGVFSTMLLPAGPCLSVAFLRNPVWAAWRRYFRFSVVFDGKISLVGKKYVIPECPHGVFPLGQLIATSLADMCWPGHPIYALAADAVFHVPLWRHVMTWLGGIPATAASFRRALQKGSVGLIPGGIAEMFMIDDDKEIIKLRDRKGFVRLAVEAGADIVPCYHFGNSQLFRFGPRWLEPYARKHRVALGLLVGRWGLPLGLPNHVPIMFVVGAPIAVKQTARSDPGFAAAVDDAHGQLIEAMQTLYDKYKGMYGWADRPLVIV